jgi:indolepyruvate ferredoxin oxidoreductase, alpha subunit
MDVAIKEQSNTYAPRTFNKFATPEIAREAPGEIAFMSGAESIARGALEAGVAVSASYPGSPATWVQENLILAAKTFPDLYVEWSTNEAKSFDVCVGASLAGKRAFAPLKQVGVNWILDSLTDWVIKRIRGGLVVMIGDDPGGDTTTDEQDTRFLAQFVEVPLFEPSNVQEQKDSMLHMFELSEAARIPVFVRLTRPEFYGRGPVKLGPIRHDVRRRPAQFKGDADEYGFGLFQSSPWFTSKVAERHDRHHRESLAEVRKFVETYPLNQLKMNGTEELGVIAAGIGYNYAMEAIERLGLADRVATLKYVTTWPIPEGLTQRMLSSVKKVLVVEELDPLVENQVRAISSTLPSHAEIYGKLSPGVGLPFADVYSPETVASALAALAGVEYKPKLSPERRSKVVELSNKLSRMSDGDFCPGCPLMSATYALKEAVRKAGYSRSQVVFVGDEGCSNLAELKPWKTVDVSGCMGSSISVASGLYVAGLKKKIICVIGDGALIHSGIIGLMNAVYNNVKMTILVHDNRVTAATGQQLVPSGFDENVRGEKIKQLSLEALVRASGVDHVETLDPYEIDTCIDKLAQAYRYDGISVVISRRICSLIETRHMGSRGGIDAHVRPFYIDPDKCTLCMICSRIFACSAIYDRGNNVAPVIDSIECIGCGICIPVCPDDAIFQSR